MHHTPQMLQGSMIPPPQVLPQLPVIPPPATHTPESIQPRRTYQSRSIVWDAIGILNTACASIYQTIDDCVNSLSRPRWVERPGWIPFAQQSYDIGNYEYEVMVYRRPLSFCEKLQEKSAAAIIQAAHQVQRIPDQVATHLPNGTRH
eukprot:Blabericola_migrator_1__6956@NODE_3523_length_1708_cov_117_929311_g2188_i0_p2_GENE_NODE_3523_length_1708_cov_117_929311_g2188_i0NODE_3523_length_1708_cov_117_929311_g2188_i0_p2_ORF_typecomplete_len147_score10_23_NODE_3523_length_1708_cov_117_929311_g2188_i065505